MTGRADLLFLLRGIFNALQTTSTVWMEQIFKWGWELKKAFYSLSVFSVWTDDGSVCQVRGKKWSWMHRLIIDGVCSVNVETDRNQIKCALLHCHIYLSVCYEFYAVKRCNCWSAINADRHQPSCLSLYPSLSALPCDTTLMSVSDEGSSWCSGVRVASTEQWCFHIQAASDKKIRRRGRRRLQVSEWEQYESPAGNAVFGNTAPRGKLHVRQLHML